MVLTVAATDTTAVNKVVTADPADFESAIQLTGYGRFHWGVVFVGCVCMMCSGFENAMNSYILPSAQCDLDMTTQGMGLLNVLFLAGGISSALFCGILADMMGRKTVMVTAMFVDMALLLLSSLSQHLAVLLVFRFISGFVIGAPASIVIPYVAEFHSGKHQTLSVCYVNFFWALSLMLVPAIAWLIIPITWSYRVPHFTFNSWRMFVAFFAIPSALGAFLMTLLPESPRFLLTKGRTQEAHKVLSRMYAVNTRNPPEMYPMPLLKLVAVTDSLRAEVIHKAANSDKASSCKTILIAVWQQLKEVLRPPHLFNALICAGLMGSAMFGAYGLGLWFPELFQRFIEVHNQFPNRTTTVCDTGTKKSFPFIQTRMINSTDYEILTEVNHHQCDGGNVVDQNVFLNTLIISTTCMFADIVYALVANKVSNGVLLAVPLAVAAVCSFALYFLHTSTQILIIGCLFQGNIEITYFGVYSVVMDNFPTSIRAIAMCTIILGGRIAAIVINLVIGELLDTMCGVPIFLTGSAMFVGCFLVLWVPSNQSGRQSSGPTPATVCNLEHECCDTRL